MVGANPETLALEASVQSTYVCQKCDRDLFSILNYHQVEGGEVHRVVANPAFQA